MGTVNTVLNNGLAPWADPAMLILGMILGGMMAIDMGGPFNKAAYVFGTAAIAAGNYDIMASGYDRRYGSSVCDCTCNPAVQR